jgi:hypothetical protein
VPSGDETFKTILENLEWVGELSPSRIPILLAQIAARQSALAADLIRKLGKVTMDAIDCKGTMEGAWDAEMILWLFPCLVPAAISNAFNPTISPVLCANQKATEPRISPTGEHSDQTNWGAGI